MASRIYDIVLKCGCMLSPDGGGGLISCFNEKKCKYGDFMSSLDGKKYRRDVSIRNDVGYVPKEWKKILDDAKETHKYKLKKIKRTDNNYHITYYEFLDEYTY